jgi:exonuclease SbcC
MRPLRLTIEGLRSFRSPVEILFEGRDHLAVVGDTGAGKSSIIEAITYALFGRTTFSGKANQEIVNDLATHMRVVLRFTVSGREYEVTRVLRRAGDRTVGAARAALTEFGADGSEVRKVEQVRQVDAEVEKILGLDAETFLRTVVLPQGQFAQLLVDDDPAKRAEILRQVWRADELVKAGQLAAEAVQELGPLVGRVSQELEGTPEDPTTHLRELEGKADQLVAVAKRERVTHTTAIETRQRLSEAVKTGATAEAMLADIEKFDFGRVETSTEKIVQIADILDAERVASADKRAELSNELAAIPSDDDGISRQGIGAARLTLSGLPGLAEAVQAAAADARKVAADAASLVSHSVAIEAELLELDRKLGEHEAARQALDSNRENAERNLTRARELLRGARQFARQASQFQAQARAKQSELQGIELVITRLESEELPDARRRTEVAVQALADAQRHDSAAHAAQGLRPGDPCAVCRRPLPDPWVPPVAEGLDAATAAETNASRELSQLRERLTDRRARGQSIQDQITELAAQAEQGLQDAQDRLMTLAPQLGLVALEIDKISSATTDADRRDDELLAPLVIAAAQAEQALQEQQTTVQAVNEKRAVAQGKASQAEQELGRIQSTLDRRTGDVGSAVGRLRDSLASLPTSLPITATLPADPVTTETVVFDGIGPATAALEIREQELQRREQRRNALTRQVGELNDQLRGLNDRWDREVAMPVAEQAAVLNHHRDLLARGIERLDIRDIALGAALATAQPAELIAMERALRANSDSVAKHARLEAEAAQAATTESRQTIDQLAAGLGIDPADRGKLADQVIALASERATAAEVETRTARHVAESFAMRVQPLTRLRACEPELAAAHLALRDLSVALKPGGFPKWLTLRRSRALLVHASRLLNEMTGGRYAFAELTDEAGDWRVVDNDSGLARTPASLSGGEKFLASLGLALGMVEMMARSGGRLESLWLDEGFGALDSANLDAAIEALTSAATSGRMVAVISHVKAVAEQVNDVLAVTREPTGTSVAWLNAAERTRLAEGDLGTEAAAALSGLLE